MTYTPLNLQQATALLKERAPHLLDAVDFEMEELLDEDEEPELFWHDGDLTLEGNFSVDRPCLIVTGDVDVTGVFSDCEELDFTLTIVLGKVKAGQLLTFGEMILVGDVAVDELIWANSGNDYRFRIMGDVTARAIVEAGMSTTLSGSVDAEFIASLTNEITDGTKAIVPRGHLSPKYIFPDPYLDDDQYPKERDIIEAVIEQKTVLKDLTKPDGLPLEAQWSATDGEWVVKAFDDPAVKTGVISYYRPDGTLCEQTNFVDGIPDGPYTRYHETGEISRTGSFDKGRLVGTHVFTRSTGYTTEKFGGFADSVRKVEYDYRGEKVIAFRCYDVDGNEVDKHGKPK